MNSLLNIPQLRTILWLRVRLTQNLWRRSGGWGAVAAVVMLIGVLAMALGGLAGGFGLGAFVFPKLELVWTEVAWAALSVGFLGTWVLGLITELQRSESIDLAKLLHLPVSLGQLFVVNYVASLFGFTTVIFVPMMTGFAAGLAFTRGPSELLLLPLVLGFLFVTTAWTYWLQGFIANWVRNPRRRRALVMGLTFAVVLCFQVPNLLFNVLPHARGEARPPRGDLMETQRRQLALATEAADFIPLLWVAAGARHLGNGEPGFALGATAGFALLGALGLMRAYRSTLTYYRGAAASAKGGAAAVVHRVEVSRSPRSRQWVERRYPFVSEQVSAIATASFRALIRAPEVLMAFGASAMTILFVLFIQTRMAKRADGPVRALMLYGVLVFVTMTSSTFLWNGFGYDRNAARSYFLAPVSAERILLGKGLGLLPLAASLPALCIVIGGLVLKMPVLDLGAAAAQWAAMFAVELTLGAFLSVRFPFRIRPGSMRASKPPTGVMVVIFLATFTTPALLTPVGMGPLAAYVFQREGWAYGSLVNLALSLIAAMATVLLYGRALPSLGRMLWRRLPDLVAKVTVEEE